MAKKPPAGRCVHCLSYARGLDWDHGYPRSWYPRGSSSAKPKAPSCRPCQIRLERAERAVLVPFALSLAPGDPLAAGVPEAVHRAMDPDLATNDRERRARLAMKEELRSRIVFPTSSRGAFPGFSAEDVGANTAAVKQDARDVLVVGEKFVRVALWFLKGGQFVEPDRQVKVHIVDRHGDSLVDALVGAGCRTQIAPGAVITISTPVDDPRTHLILFELWGRLRLCASVLAADAGASK